MAKKKTGDDTPTSRAGISSPYDSMFAQATDLAKGRFPGEVFSGTDEAMRLVSVPLPAFSTRYLIQGEGWPLSRFVLLDGEHESFKSAFGYEIGGWHHKLGGGFSYYESESKPAIEFLYSFLGYGLPRFTYQRTLSVEAYTKAILDYIGDLQNLFDAGPGRVAVFAVMLDSIAAALLQSRSDQIEHDGTPDKHFGEVAWALSEWLPTVTKKLATMPGSFVAVNHMKPTQVKSGGGGFSRTVRNVSGGKALNFYDTMEIEMRRVSSRDGEKSQLERLREGLEGARVELTIFKNALAPHRSLEVEVLWKLDAEDRNPITRAPRQHSYWDWHSASVELLESLTAGEGARAKAIRKFLDLETDKNTRRAWSTDLKIPPKSKVSFREFGMALEEKIVSDAEFADQLYLHTGVRRRFMWRQGVDYQEQMRLAALEAVGLDAASPGEPGETPFSDETEIAL